MEMTRRSLLMAAAAASTLHAEGLSAGEIVERIKKNVGVPWRAETVDTIKSGSPETTVRGIATTMMATFDVIQRAAAANRNFVITHEPTFYSHEDKTDALKSDPVYQQKQAFLDKNQMVVFRFHDHWHAHRPDGIATGMMEALGWAGKTDFEGITLGELAKQIRDKLKIQTMRVVGDPQLKVHTVRANWGYSSAPRAFSRSDMDVLIIGEAREWELIEYATDAITAGQKKGLIVLGHIVSEQGGMLNCANWLKTFVTEMPVEFIPAPEPFWRPA